MTENIGGCHHHLHYAVPEFPRQTEIDDIDWLWSLPVRFVLRLFGLYHTKEPDHCVIVLCMYVYVNKL